jgi:hypothetical protein
LAVTANYELGRDEANPKGITREEPSETAYPIAALLLVGPQCALDAKERPKEMRMDAWSRSLKLAAAGQTRSWEETSYLTRTVFSWTFMVCVPAR